MNKLVGKCGHCGGRVTVPTIWHSVVPPTPQCESCHGQIDDTASLPTLPMRPKAKEQPLFRELHERQLSRQTGWPVSSEDICGSSSTARYLNFRT